MMTIKIGVSPITNTIFAGRLNKAGTLWLKGKVDVTDECCMAVVTYLKRDAIRYERGGKTYELKEVLVDE
ncbi:MAG: hypothetical protein R8M45_00400 [Ghiorsea sp.]